MDSPITLIIRAPNQRVEDHTVECMLGWTVKKLKTHLKDVYPSQPDEAQQRLIYSGKLLADEMKLSEILRQNDDQLHHTVHLVCSPSSLAAESQNQTSSPWNSTPINSNTQQTSIPSYGGLRHRGQPTPVVSENEFISTTASPQASFQSPPVMMGGSEAILTPEQYMMMMQSYYYQMAAAQYMQYYQTGATPVTPPNTPGTEEVTNQHQAQPAANPPPAAQNPNMVMNAQGGMVEEDEDEEFGNRDWLDYIYTFSRFLVLVGIVYFYSNFTRFFAVCAFFFMVYLYRVGWFTLRRRQQAPAQQEQQQQQQQNVENEHQEQQQNNEQVNTENAAENNTENNEEAVNQAPQEEAPPGVFSVAWCFVSTFFTSLIPAPPEPVNAN